MTKPELLELVQSIVSPSEGVSNTFLEHELAEGLLELLDDADAMAIALDIHVDNDRARVMQQMALAKFRAKWGEK